MIDRAKLEPIVEKAIKNGRVISTEGMPKETWLGLRNIIGLGGSEVATVLGINPYKTAYKLWQEKVSDEIEVIENKFTIWGNLLEGPIADEYMRQTGNIVVEDKKIRIHSEHRELFVNLDRVVMQDGIAIGIVEIKTTTQRNYNYWQKDADDCVEGIPLTYYCQVQHELSVSNMPWCDLVFGLIDARELVIRRITRDDEYIKRQNTALVGWWNAYVVQNVAPPMTAAEYSFVDPMAESYVEATGEIAELYANLKGKKETLKSLDKEIERDEDKIKEFMGDRENLILIDKVIASWKMQKRESIDSKKLKSEMPDIAEKYNKVSQFRVLRLKELN